MEDLKSGEILIRIDDDSPWEFLHYSFGKNTHRAEDNIPAGSLFDKTSIFVKPIKPRSNFTADIVPRDFKIELFKKAPIDYIL